jgi:hypothetical protein
MATVYGGKQRRKVLCTSDREMRKLLLAGVLVASSAHAHDYKTGYDERYGVVAVARNARARASICGRFRTEALP